MSKQYVFAKLCQLENFAKVLLYLTFRHVNVKNAIEGLPAINPDEVLNKNKKKCSFKSNENIHKNEDGSY